MEGINFSVCQQHMDKNIHFEAFVMKVRIIERLLSYNLWREVLLLAREINRHHRLRGGDVGVRAPNICRSDWDV